MAERFIKVLSRRAADGKKSMWGTLYFSLDSPRESGWLSDSWSESADSPAEILPPRFYWLSKQDNKFYKAHIEIPTAGRTSIHIDVNVADLEPVRDAFIRTTIRSWEDDYFASEGVSLS